LNGSNDSQTTLDDRGISVADSVIECLMPEQPPWIFGFAQVRYSHAVTRMSISSNH
jgi:hypothetical protein